MTDRVHSLLVVLDFDIRDDDVKPTIDAILQIKHVLKVSPNVSSGIEDHVAMARMGTAVTERLLDLAKDLREGRVVPKP